jgi:hypothetical protein
VSCPWSVRGSIVGRYYIVGPDRLVQANVDLTELAQELGRLAMADDRTFDSDSEWEQQVEAAVAAASFVHPRLAPVSVELTSAERRALRPMSQD